MLGQRAFGSYDLAGQLIERLVFGQTAMNPLILPVSVLVSKRLTIDAQQIRKLQRPVVVELRPLEQGIDKLHPTVGASINEEGLRLV